MPIPDAERLKRRSGCALTSLVPEDETMEVASMAGRRARMMPRRVLSEILQPRAEEICHLLWDEIRRAGYEKSLNSGITLTGGGAMLEGMVEIAEQIFDLPVRRASPEGVGGLADHVSNPAFATSVGLIVYAHRNIQSDPRVGVGAIGRITDRLRGLFKEFF
jgi:cell division protein FtsA